MTHTISHTTARARTTDPQTSKEGFDYAAWLFDGEAS